MKLHKLIISAMILTVAGISTLSAKTVKTAQPNDKEITILYTNDVHCGIDGELGYANLSAYKNEMAKTNYVALVDNGDVTQGDVIGAISKGEYLIDIMNNVGYDFAVFGNHEFDYGMEQLKYLVGKSNFQWLTANIQYTGKNETFLSKTVPYAIKKYGNKKVAFIGLTTPDSITSSTPTYFQENGKFVYSFVSNKDGKSLNNLVQKTVNKARKQGADYVILMTHLGDQPSASGSTSLSVIENTTGINAVLDGHAHSVIAQTILKNKKGEDVLLTSTGTKFANFGKLTITKDGKFSSELIASYADKDEATQTFITSIQNAYKADLDKVVAHSDISLPCSREDGTRAVRNRETVIGNIIADAYREIAKTDIAFVNGGGIRADLPAGDITYGNIIKTHPFGNMLTSVKATGQQIIDCLEHSVRYTQNVASENGKAVGENGGFQNVSGLKFTVDTSIPSSVETDDKGLFVKVAGERRVKDVMVLEGSNWVAIDPVKTYTVASHDYMLLSSGDGFTMFKDDEVLIDRAFPDYQVLITYLTDILNGNVSAKYSGIEGRIIIK